MGQTEQSTRRVCGSWRYRASSPPPKDETYKGLSFAQILYRHRKNYYLANRFMRKPGVEGSGLSGGPMTWWAAWRHSLLQ